jgi:hypothetical protein
MHTTSTIWEVVAPLWFCLIIIVVARFSKKRTDGKYIAERKEKELYAYNDWQDDLLRIRTWQTEHPLGPVFHKDYQELNDLRLREIGSYYLYCMAINRPPFDNYSEEQLEKTEDWIS